MKMNTLLDCRRRSFFCLALALAFAPSCKDDDTEDKQRKDIERYITGSLNAEIDEKDGVYYVPLSVDSSSERVPVEQGDLIEVEYEAMVFGGGLFATSIDSVAIQNGLEPNHWGGAGAGVEVGVGKLIPGIDRGLLRMALGEQAIIIFPFTLGYGKKYVGLVPPQSALVFNVLITKVEKR